MSRYNFQETEPKWQATWSERRAFHSEADPSRPKYYVLEMFPYPSGRIHMGHVRNYTMGDLVARYKRARGFNVLHPMGWDAFGLPAENAARDQKIHPASWTYDNIAVMRAELQRMGLALDWERELATCHPGYYAQQQRLFLDFHKAGLAYRKEAFVNWDPVDHTVLANEQVIDGRGWRSGAIVEKRKLSQWFLKITAYGDDLLAQLKKLDRWPEKVRLMQENWIGKSTGAYVHFEIEGISDKQTIFTTRPDTLYGASFLALSPDHPLSDLVAQSEPGAAEFIAECRAAGTSEAIIEAQEKRGFRTKLEAVHPFTGKKLPVFIANFVLMEYGTGAIFGSAGHDQRDLDFARKYGLEVLPVVLPPGETPESFKVDDVAYTGEGTIYNSDFLNGLSIDDAIQKACEKLEQLGAGEGTTIYRLRDWLVSRQRYWGCPIPMVHCTACGIVPVPQAQLPVLLPDDVTFDKPGNPLDHHPTWKHTACHAPDRPRQDRRAVRGPVHPGHGAARILQGRCRQVAVSRRGGEARRRHGHTCKYQAPDRGRPQGGHVQVQEERGAAGAHHRDLRRRHCALVRAVGLAARARHGMDRGRGRGRLALHPAPVAHRDRLDRGSSRAGQAW
jgi:leucyl-tRNA synthetase